MAQNMTLEEMKARSQNLGHADVLTTFTSYGNVSAHRQGELIRTAGVPRSSGVDSNAVILARTLLAKMA